MFTYRKIHSSIIEATKAISLKGEKNFNEKQQRENRG